MRTLHIYRLELIIYINSVVDNNFYLNSKCKGKRSYATKFHSTANDHISFLSSQALITEGRLRFQKNCNKRSHCQCKHQELCYDVKNLTQFVFHSLQGYTILTLAEVCQFMPPCDWLKES